MSNPDFSGLPRTLFSAPVSERKDFDVAEILKSELPDFQEIVRQPDKAQIKRFAQHLARSLLDGKRIKQCCDRITEELRVANQRYECITSARNAPLSHMDYKILEERHLTLRSDFDALKEMNLKHRMQIAELQNHILQLEKKKLTRRRERRAGSAMNCTVGAFSEVSHDRDAIKKKSNEQKEDIVRLCQENVRELDFRQRSDECCHRLRSMCLKMHSEKSYLCEYIDHLMRCLLEEMKTDQGEHNPNEMGERSSVQKQLKATKKDVEKGRVPTLAECYRELVRVRRLHTPLEVDEMLDETRARISDIYTRAMNSSTCAAKREVDERKRRAH